MAKVQIIKSFTSNPDYEAISLGNISDKAVNLLAAMCRTELCNHNTCQNLIRLLTPVFFRNANKEAMLAGHNNYALSHFADRKNISYKNLPMIATALKTHLAIHLKEFWNRESIYANRKPEDVKLYINFNQERLLDMVKGQPAEGYTCYTYEEYRYLYETLLGRRSALKSGKYSEETVKAMTSQAQADSFTCAALTTMMNEIKNLKNEREEKLSALRIAKDKEYNEFYRNLIDNFKKNCNEVENSYDAKISDLEKQINALALMQ